MSKQISNKIVRGINFISLPGVLSELNLLSLHERLKTWTTLEVDTHVYDFRATQSVSEGCLAELQDFAMKIKAQGNNLISVNMPDSIFQDVKRLGLENTFNRTLQLTHTVQHKNTLTENEMRRLLIRDLVKGVFAAVEVSFNSTVACDENYSSKAEAVPLDQFDLISIIDVNTPLLRAEIRLGSSNLVLEKLTRAMLGPVVVLDTELIESMALELLNMTYSFAKSNLNTMDGFSLPAAIPRLVRRNHFHRIKRSSATNLKIMPMVTPMGSFYVEVDFGKQA
jgi:anti-anti-sigma regulatory factor